MIHLGLRQISKSYNGQKAVDAVDLDVPVGSRTAIVGPSGSGKTTLLRIIAGFEPPDTGKVTLNGHVLVNGSVAVPAHQRGIGVVHQDGALFPHLSVADNIGFGLERAMPDRDRWIGNLMEVVELEPGMRDRKPHELSGGQQQRVALARALARRPKLMLFDEPFSALDTGLRGNMRKAVARVLDAAGITAVIVTHDQAEALSFADQVAVLREGRLVQAGPPSELYQRPIDPQTAVFLGEAMILPATLGDGFADCGLGRVEAVTGTRRGQATILIRPEQIRLFAGDGSNEDAALTACHARVTGVEYGGATCSVSLAISGSGSDPKVEPSTPLVVTVPSIDVPRAGSRVSLTVRGAVHVFKQ